MGERGCARRLGEWVCVAIRACCGARGPLCCGATPQGMCKASHDSGMCWKQFMVRLERILGLWRHFILPPCTTRGRRSSNVQLGSACARVPVYYSASSSVVVHLKASLPEAQSGSRRFCFYLEYSPKMLPNGISAQNTGGGFREPHVLGPGGGKSKYAVHLFLLAIPNRSREPNCFLGS